MKSDELRKTFEDNCIRLQTELDVIKRDLDERNRDLKKERLRIETMIRQEEVNTKFNPQIFSISHHRITKQNKRHSRNRMKNYLMNVNY